MVGRSNHAATAEEIFAADSAAGRIHLQPGGSWSEIYQRARHEDIIESNRKERMAVQVSALEAPPYPRVCLPSMYK